MKIRQGFVTNSSSSSFIIIIKEETFKSHLEAAHEYTKSVIDKLDKETKVLFGTNVVIFTGYSTDNYGSFDDISVENIEAPDGVEGPDDAFYQFINKLPEDDKFRSRISY